MTSISYTDLHIDKNIYMNLNLNVSCFFSVISKNEQ